MGDNDPDINDTTHPLRRREGGPSDVEWALLTLEFKTMKKAVEDLTDEVKKFMAAALGKCETCEATKKYADHETRIRDLEKMVWKASAAAAVLAGSGSFVASKLFN